MGRALGWAGLRAWVPAARPRAQGPARGRALRYMYVHICMYMYMYICICICVYVYIESRSSGKYQVVGISQTTSS